MADPYILIRKDSTKWLPSFASDLAVSATFYRRLEADPAGLESDLYRGVWPYSHPTGSLVDRRRELLEILRRVELVSYEGIDLPDNQVEVRDALAEGDGWYGRILADEWAFLQSRSSMISSRRRVLDAFRKAGASVVEHGRRTRDRFIQMVAPGELPSVITPVFLAKVGVKWLIVGGATAGGSFVGSVAGAGFAAAGSLAGLASLPMVQAFDP